MCNYQQAPLLCILDILKMVTFKTIDYDSYTSTSPDGSIRFRSISKILAFPFFVHKVLIWHLCKNSHRLIGRRWHIKGRENGDRMNLIVGHLCRWRTYRGDCLNISWAESMDLPSNHGTRFSFLFEDSLFQIWSFSDSSFEHPSSVVRNLVIII